MASHMGEWIRSPLGVGGIVPSSRALATAIADEVARAEPRLVLDVGTGTGIIARAIAERLPHARVVGLDVRARLLPREDALVEHVVADAEHAPVRRADVVVSSLPFGGMTRADTRRILRALRALSPHFVAYQYSRRRYGEIAHAYPHVREAARVLANLPPAIVLSTLPPEDGPGAGQA